MTAAMGSESDGFLTGTEADLTYQIGGDASQTVYLHWDNPFVGSNAYHTNTDPDHDAWWTALPGNNAVANFVLRPSRRVQTDFLPSRDGFKFANKWPDTPYSLPPLRGSFVDQKYGNAANGLCGGMVFAAIDYFNAGRRIPQDEAPPFGEREPLFIYLVDRLFDTFSVSSVLMMLSLIDPKYPDTDENGLSALGLANGRAAVMAHQEWPQIRADIDAGKPSPLFLQTIKSLLPWDLGHCHQVLAYAYEAKAHQVTLWLYDPNQPSIDDVTLRFNDGDVANRMVVEHIVDVWEDDGVHRRPIYCFARMDYSPKAPAVATPPRVTIAEADSRGVTLESARAVQEHNALRSGRKKFDVIPDCGEREFDWEIASERQVVTMTATPHGYVTPTLAWSVNGIAIAPGESDVVVDDAATVEGYNPVTASEPDWSPVVPPVAIHLALDGHRLEISNRPEDGNYALSVRVTCHELGETEVSARQENMVAFLGQRETVFGLREAIDRCMVAWLNGLQVEPDLEAMVAAMFAQLGRPADPIWDPDPTLLMFDRDLERDNPNWAGVEAMQELEVVDPGGDDGLEIVDHSGDDALEIVDHSGDDGLEIVDHSGGGGRLDVNPDTDAGAATDLFEPGEK